MRKLVRGKFLKFIIAALFGAFLPLAVQAQSGSPGGFDVSDFYTISDQDKSAALLQGLIGPVFNQVTGFGGTTPVQDVNNSQIQGGLLGALSAVLTRACMILTVIIMAWGWFTGTASAAYEGASAHRRYNTLWVPLRSVTAFGMLVPWAGGYCAIQVVIMKLALLGIGMANAGFTATVDYVNSAQPIGFFNQPKVSELASNLASSEICRYSFNRANTFSSGTSVVPVNIETGATSTSVSVASNQKLPIATIASLVTNPVYTAWTAPFNTWTTAEYKDAFGLRYASADGSGLPSDYCGSYTADQSRSGDANGSTAQAIFAAKASAFNSLRSAMEPIAAQIVESSQPGSTVDQGTLTSQQSSWKSQYVAAVTAYQNTIQTAVTNAYSAAQANGSAGIPSATATDIKNAGWIMAGGIYWNLASQNQRLLQAIGDPPQGNGPDISKFMKGINSSFGNPNTEVYKNAIAQQDVFLRDVAGIGGDPFTATPELEQLAKQDMNDSPASVSGAFRYAMDYMGLGIVDWFTNYMVGQGDFVYNMQSLGQNIFATGTTMFVVAGAAKFASGLVGGSDEAGSSGLASTVGKVASVIKPVGIIAKAINMVAGALFALAPVLILIGFFMGFYLPFVPLFLWIINVIGWMIQVLKALIAGPIWAAAHSIPEGEGIAGTHAKEGYMLVLGLVLRPLLLVIGLFLGMLTLEAAGKVCGLLFPIMARSASINSTVGLFSALAFMAMFTGLLIALAHKCFALSHEVADEILRWIGGGMQQLGDSHTSESARTIVMQSMGGRIERMAGSAMQPSPGGSGGGRAGGGGGKGGDAGTQDPSAHISTR